jgi:hypothetical protein
MSVRNRRLLTELLAPAFGRHAGVLGGGAPCGAFLGGRAPQTPTSLASLRPVERWAHV